MSRRLREAQLQSLTERVAANEQALRSLVDALVAQRHGLAQPEKAPERTEEEAPRTLGPMRVH